MDAQIFGRYQITGKLGRGGMATVFRAHDPEFGRDVSIKVLPHEYRHDPDFRARFQREAQTIAALEHPAIVPVYDYGEHEGQPYLVMRYMRGGSLSDRMAEGLLSLAETIHLADQIAPAIDYAHLRGIIHRDLKPANILFDTEGYAFIADFGIAKLLHSTAQMTASGAYVGTAAYMSPEQIQAASTLDGRSDVYSLGVLLFEALTGRHPFLPNSPVGYFAAHLHEPVPDICAIKPDLPQVATEMMFKALAKDRDERYQTAGDLAADLHRLAVPVTAPIVIEGAQATQPQAAGRQTHITARRPRALTGIAGIVMVLGIAALAFAVRGSLSGAGRGGAQQVVVQVTQTPDNATITHSSDEVPADLPSRTATPELRDLMPPALRSSWIAFSSDMSDPDIMNAQLSRAQYNEIYTIRADGSRLTRLTVNQASDRQPSWSPDGAQMVFASNRDDGDWEIYVMDADGLNQTRLTDSAGDDTDPDWSPDGTRIAFVSKRDGNPELYVMDADGSNLMRLTDDPARDEWPNWSPDGSQILFQSSRTGHYEIFTYDLSTGESTQLTRDTLYDSWQPAWSSDAEWMAYAGVHEKYAIGLSEVRAGSAVEWFVPTPAPPAQPAWSPDGRWIVANFGVRFEWDWRSLIVVPIDTFGGRSPLYYEILDEPGEHKDPDWSWAP